MHGCDRSPRAIRCLPSPADTRRAGAQRARADPFRGPTPARLVSRAPQPLTPLRAGAPAVRILGGGLGSGGLRPRAGGVCVQPACARNAAAQAQAATRSRTLRIAFPFLPPTGPRLRAVTGASPIGDRRRRATAPGQDVAAGEREGAAEHAYGFAYWGSCTSTGPSPSSAFFATSGFETTR